MKRRFPLTASLLAAIGLIPLAQAAFPEQEVSVTQLIIQPSSFHAAHASHLDAAAMAPFMQATGVVMEHVRPLPGQMQVFRLPYPMHPDEARAYARRLVESGVARMAEPDLRVYPSRVPNDPQYSNQWHDGALVTGPPYGQNNYGLNLPAAWDITTGSDSIIVAVIDTGILLHEDLDAGRILPGYDFISDPFTANDGDGRDADPSDPGDWVSADEGQQYGCEKSSSSWHGTYIAGIIGAATDNATGVAGIDWRARLLPVRVLGKCGGEMSDIIDALHWAAGQRVPNVPDNPHPARVINLSLSGLGSCPQSLQSAFDAIQATGATVVVAAGNDAKSAGKYFPGNCRGVITVAATDRQGQRASYTNIGSVVTLSAPGGDPAVDTGILSLSNRGTTVPRADGYAFATGTSMAAAQVSGLVALMYAVNPRLTSEQVRDALRATATPFPQYGTPRDCSMDTCGAGIARADWAVRAAQGEDFVPDPFQFASQENVDLGVVVTSQPVTISGLSHETHISVRNGEYSIGCGNSFTREPGVISNGQSVCVRHTAANTPNTTTKTTLTVGSVSATFTTTTKATEPTRGAEAPSSGGGGGATGLLSLLGLAGLAAWRRRWINLKGY